MAQHVELNTDQSYIDEVKSIARKHGLELFAIEAAVGAGVGVAAELEEDKIKIPEFIWKYELKVRIFRINNFVKSKD